MIGEVQVAGVEACEGDEGGGLRNGRRASVQGDQPRSLEGMQHPADMHRGERRDVGDHHLPDAAGEALLHIPAGGLRPCPHLADEVGDPPLRLPAGIDQPLLPDAEFDERQPPQRPLDAGMAPDQAVDRAGRDVGNGARGQRFDGARQRVRRAAARAAEVAGKVQGEDPARAVGQHRGAAGDAVHDQVRAARLLPVADVGSGRHQPFLRREGEEGPTLRHAEQGGLVQPPDEPCQWGHRLHPSRPQGDLMSMRLASGGVTAALGSVTVRIPLSMLAWMSSALMPAGSSRARTKAP